MINLYKFESVRDYGHTFADLLDSCLPQFPDNTVIVPMPTIRQHIRERGFDHIDLITRELAMRRHLPICKILGRAKNTVQVGATREERLRQANVAYKILCHPNEHDNYLVIDDVWTTGASLKAACSLLKENGAHNVMVAVLARALDP